MDDLVTQLSSDPGHTGIFSDFDGTLARIVDDPADAQAVDGASEALRALADTYQRVGVISGRPAQFLIDRLDGRGLFLSGLYGMETVESGAVVATEEAAGWKPVVADLAAQARRDLGQGVYVEDKGLSVTIHYRRALDQVEAARRYAEEAARSTGLVMHEARLSFELAPPIVSSKGTVLAEVAGTLGAACFIGDDIGDLTAFDALDDLAAAGASAFRIGVESPEAPPDLLRRADLVLEGPEVVVSFLQRLLP
ncbi:MAG TPA: trehalose-phosphatase [Acidimicrobiales bacterium]